MGWIKVVGAKTAYVEHGSPRENGYCESFNGRLRDQLLNGEIVYSLREVQIIVESWRNHYNTKQSRSAGGLPPTCTRGRLANGTSANHAQLSIWTT